MLVTKHLQCRLESGFCGEGHCGFHLDEDNNIYVPDLTSPIKMLYKLVTDTNIRIIPSAEAYWDGTGMITWGEFMNSTDSDRNTVTGSCH